VDGSMSGAQVRGTFVRGGEWAYTNTPSDVGMAC